MGYIKRKALFFPNYQKVAYKKYFLGLYFSNVHISTSFRLNYLIFCVAICKSHSEGTVAQNLVLGFCVYLCKRMGNSLIISMKMVIKILEKKGLRSYIRNLKCGFLQKLLIHMQNFRFGIHIIRKTCTIRTTSKKVNFQIMFLYLLDFITFLQ